MNYLHEIWAIVMMIGGRLFDSGVCGTGASCADPGTIGLIFTAASAAMSVIGGIQESQTQKANAKAAQADAAAALEQGKAESERQKRINVARQAELVAATGGSGTTMTGSPMEIYLENAKQASLEEQDPIYGAKLKARGLTRQADIYNRQATNSLFQGFGGAGSRLGSGASTLLSWSSTPKLPKPGPEPTSWWHD